MYKIIIAATALFIGACNNDTSKTTHIQVDTSKALPSQKASKDAEMQALPKPYHPEEDAAKIIDSLTTVAEAEGKRIMIQAGGNWCIWCLRFDKYRLSQPELMSILEQHYLYYHLNYSEENKNEALFVKYGNPDKHGFPVFIVLNADGTVAHVQESGSLEEGGSYSLEKVKAFFEKWIPAKK